MELRAADKLEEISYTNSDKRFTVTENAVEIEGSQVRKQTMEWIAKSAQPIFRHTWAGSRQQSAS